VTEAQSIDPDVYIVSEVWSSENEIAEYYTYFSNFDFGMSQFEGEVSRTALGITSVNAYANYLRDNRNRSLNKNPLAQMSPFLANHDMDRPAGYLSVVDYRMHMAANLYMLSSGNAFVYYGEEIGMKGSRGSANTDANRRLAMLWGDNDSVNNPVGTTYSSSFQTNGTVKDQLNDPTSLLNHYKKILLVKQAFPVIARGQYRVINLNLPHVGGWIVYDDSLSLLILHNTSVNDVTLPLSIYPQLETPEKVIANLGKDSTNLTNNILTLSGLTTGVYRLM
jgi:glycosidase